jgi:hypothetical protein
MQESALVCLFHLSLYTHMLECIYTASIMSITAIIRLSIFFEQAEA